MNRKFFMYLFLGMVSFFIVGCSSEYQVYSGPRLTAKQEATIGVVCPAVIRKIDDHWMFGLHKTFLLTSGEHTISVMYLEMDLEGGVKSDNALILKFNALAGKNYELDCATHNNNSWTAAIIDSAGKNITTSIQSHCIELNCTGALVSARD